MEAVRFDRKSSAAKSSDSTSLVSLLEDVPTATFPKISIMGRIRLGPPVKVIGFEPSEEEKKIRWKFCGLFSTDAQQMDIFGRRLSPDRVVDFVRLLRRSRSYPDKLRRDRKCLLFTNLGSEGDIDRFHSKISKECFAMVRGPLGLCYAHQPKRKHVAGALKYLYAPHQGEQTYCGARMTVNIEDRSWISTIGGLIAVGDKLYAMTTAHAPDDETDSDVDSDHDLFGEGTNAADSSDPEQLFYSKSNLSGGPIMVDEIILDEIMLDGIMLDGNGKAVRGHKGLAETTANRPDPPPFKLATPDIRFDASSKQTFEGRDWRLVEVAKSGNYGCNMPNYIRKISNTSRSEDLLELDTVRHHLSSITDPRPRMLVLITSAVGGTYSGKISSASSLVSARDGQGWVESWTVRLDHGRNLQPGDSGSWVVCALSYAVLGSIITAAPGEAHFISMSDQFEEMRRTIPGSLALTLPSPALALLDHYYFQQQAPVDLTALVQVLKEDRSSMYVDSRLVTVLSLVGKYILTTHGNNAARAFASMIHGHGRRLIAPFDSIPTNNKFNQHSTSKNNRTDTSIDAQLQRMLMQTAAIVFTYDVFFKADMTMSKTTSRDTPREIVGHTLVNKYATEVERLPYPLPLRWMTPSKHRRENLPALANLTLSAVDTHESWRAATDVYGTTIVSDLRKFLRTQCYPAFNRYTSRQSEVLEPRKGSHWLAEMWGDLDELADDFKWPPTELQLDNIGLGAEQIIHDYAPNSKPLGSAKLPRSGTFSTSSTAGVDSDFVSIPSGSDHLPFHHSDTWSTAAVSSLSPQYGPRRHEGKGKGKAKASDDIDWSPSLVPATILEPVADMFFGSSWDLFEELEPDAGPETMRPSVAP